MTGITLSENQYNYSIKKAKESNLENQVNFKLIDYRQLNEKFDKIVSVGMFEHVGRKFYKTFFNQVSKLLNDDGLALIHTIGSINQPRDPQPWVTKYIFPGGYTPSMSEINRTYRKIWAYGNGCRGIKNALFPYLKKLERKIFTQQI